MEDVFIMNKASGKLAYLYFTVRYLYYLRYWDGGEWTASRSAHCTPRGRSHSYVTGEEVAWDLDAVQYIILRNVDPLLGNDREISSYTTAVAK
jgi:hypothetical protein